LPTANDHLLVFYRLWVKCGPAYVTRVNAGQSVGHHLQFGAPQFTHLQCNRNRSWMIIAAGEW